jgi:hypothetical protein
MLGNPMNIIGSKLPIRQLKTTVAIKIERYTRDAHFEMRNVSGG